jgi:hypothetical protein
MLVNSFQLIKYCGTRTFQPSAGTGKKRGALTRTATQVNCRAVIANEQNTLNQDCI